MTQALPSLFYTHTNTDFTIGHVLIMKARSRPVDDMMLLTQWKTAALVFASGVWRLVSFVEKCMLMHGFKNIMLVSLPVVGLS